MSEKPRVRGGSSLKVLKPTANVVRRWTSLSRSSSSCAPIDILTFLAVLPEFSDHSAYLPCTSLRRFCGFSPFCCFVKSISSELLTWLVGKVSAFCLRMRGRDRITHAKLSTREQRICLVEHVAKSFENS